MLGGGIGTGRAEPKGPGAKGAGIPARGSIGETGPHAVGIESIAAAESPPSEGARRRVAGQSPGRHRS